MKHSDSGSIAHPFFPMSIPIREYILMLDSSIESIQTENRQALLREGSSRSPPSSFQHFERGGCGGVHYDEPLEIPYAVPDVTERAKAMIETVSTNSSSILGSVLHSVRSPAAFAESAKNLWQHASGGMQGSSSSSSAPVTIRATRPRGGMAGTAARIIFSSWFQYYYCAMILLNLVAMADNLIEKFALN